MLTDIEELIRKTRSTEAASYIREAYNCYNSRSYRSAIVACWIAVTFDLISKLKEMALTGNGAAKIEIDKFEDYQRQLDLGNNQQALRAALEFERSILEIVRDKFQLLDQHQYKDMLRLREDRHRCAHPAFHQNGVLFAPPAESCRLHIVNSLNHVLTQPPVQGKAALDSIVSVISSQYFPTEEDKAIVALEETELEKPTDALINAVVDDIVFGIFHKDSVHFRKKRSRIALRAISRLHKNTALPRIQVNLHKVMKHASDEHMPYLLAILSDHKDLHDQLSRAQIVKFQNYIKTTDKDFHARTVDLSLMIKPLRAEALEAIETLSIEQISNLEGFGEVEELVDHSVELFATSGSWNSVNAAWNKLIKHLIPKLNKSHVDRILKSVKNKEGDLLYSGGLSNFIDAMQDENGPMTKAEFKAELEKYELLSLIDTEDDDDDDDVVEEEIPF